MNAKPGLFAASRAYYTSTLLLLLAGLVSMPIMTRLLTKAEYGRMSLTFTLVSLLAVVGGLGFGDAALRLYGERRADGPAALRQLCNGIFGGTLLLGLGTGLAVAVYATAIGAPESEYGRCLRIGAALIAVRVVSAVLYQIYRAQERAVAHAATQVFVRYGTSILAIALLLVYRRDAFTVLLATVVVEGAAVGLRLLDLERRGVLTRPGLSPEPLAAAARYGAPLALAGAANFLLDYGDRFVIERELGLAAVATYSVAYDIAHHLAQLLVVPVELAAVPVLYRFWTQQGREETSRLASRLLSYTIALVLPVSLLYWALNDQLILLVASAKYSGSSALTAFLLPGIILGSLSFLTALGLTIEKHTGRLAATVCGAALLKLGLNLLLVPRYGLSGAAFSTTVAFTALLVVSHLLSRSCLRLRLESAVVLRTVAASALMLLLVSRAGSAAWPPWLDVAVRGGVGVGTVVLCYLLLDADLRRGVSALLPPRWSTRVR